MKNLTRIGSPRLKRGLMIFYIICALLFLADFIPIFHHSSDENSDLEILWGFYGIYGFTACVMLVLMAKLLRKLVMRAENYYDKL